MTQPMSKLNYNLFKVSFLFVVVLIPFIYSFLIGKVGAYLVGLAVGGILIYTVCILIDVLQYLKNRNKQ